VAEEGDELEVNFDAPSLHCPSRPTALLYLDCIMVSLAHALLPSNEMKLIFFVPFVQGRRCVACNSAVVNIDNSAGGSYCGGCGIVLEENTIVSEITFGETSGGAAMVQGSYVSADASESTAATCAPLVVPPSHSPCLSIL
jgi:hypothetical protein